MRDPQVDELFRQLRSRAPQVAWASFLEAYSPAILAVVRLFERDEDDAGNCYLFVCEHLQRDRFKRLLRFRFDGPASFATWLRAVVRNLCLDWHRQEVGRHRIFESVGRLPALDQAVFTSVFVECLPIQEAFLELEPKFPGLAPAGLSDAIERVRQSLSPRQRWLLAVRRTRASHALSRATDLDPETAEQVPSEAPNPESWAALQETRSALARGLSRLSPRERLLLRLRFEQDFTLAEIAALLRLENAQAADRRVRDAVDRLRREMA